MEQRSREVMDMRNSAYQPRSALADALNAELEQPETLARPPGVFVRGCDRPNEPKPPPKTEPVLARAEPKVMPASNRSAGNKRGPAPSTAPEPAKKAKATMPPGDVLVPVSPSGSSLRGRKILTMDRQFERYSEEDVVRIVRWYEGIRATILDAKRQDA